MTTSLGAFLSGLAPQFEDETRWGESGLSYSIYLTGKAPPAGLVSSARAVVIKGRSVVVVDETDRAHVMPGGRIEEGETIARALERELLEECGWTVHEPRPLALLHYRHITPKPAGYRYPYPDFLQVVFAAQAATYDRRALKRNGEIETGSRLTPIRRAMARIGRDQQVLLAAAAAELART